MNDLIKRFKEDLQLAGYAKRSIQSYISSVLRLQRFYNKKLEDITEEQLRQYWLCCQSEFGWSAASLRISYAGIQHFFTKTLVRSWSIFNEIKWKREQTLPTILSLQEVKKIIDALPTLQSHTFYLTLYSLGLRLREATTLKIGDRHCPTCQHNKEDQWLHKQMEKLLPTHYFLLTITLPQGLRDVTRSHQKIVYKALFACAHKALKKLAQDKRFIGSTRIGYLAVLHTWGSMLQYHPHIHLVIPGGALSEKADQWVSSRQDLFVHTDPLAVIFKAKFKDAMKKAKLFDKIDANLWKQQWVADSQAVGKGQYSLRYLSRYVFRVAISNHRIKSIENNIITFQYKDRSKKTWETMALDAMEFIRRFLQHVLPKGFMKIRHYGFLNPNSAFSIETIRKLILLIQHVSPDLLPVMPEYKKQEMKCACCGKPLTLIVFLKPISRWGPSG